MKFAIPNTDHNDMSSEEIIAEFDGFKVLAADVVKRIAIGLKVLKARRIKHDFFRDRILRFWKELAEDRLDPEAAIRLGNRELIKAVLPLPRYEQIAIASDKPVPVAVRKEDGEIRSDDLPIHRMDPPTLKRAFGPNGIRSVHEQAEMIRAEGKIVKIGMVTVLEEEGMFKIGNQKITPEEIQRAAPRLGYQLVLTRDLAAKAG